MQRVFVLGRGPRKAPTCSGEGNVVMASRTRGSLVFRFVQRVAVFMLVGICGMAMIPAPPAAAYPIAGTFKGAPIENCADPSIANSQGEDGLTDWYLFCTTDPLNDNDRADDGAEHPSAHDSTRTAPKQRRDARYTEPPA